MNIESLSLLPDVKLIKPTVFGDDRGYFFEGFQEQKFAALDLPTAFVQDNHSFSRHGIVRGLHFQRLYPQGKLVRVLSGKVWDVVVDIRPHSPTFSQWQAVVLDDVEHHGLYIPPGFAHGFAVLSETAHFFYKTTEFYHPEDEHVLAWNDPSLAIAWPLLPQAEQLSAKDRQGISLQATAELMAGG